MSPSLSLVHRYLTPWQDIVKIAIQDPEIQKYYSYLLIRQYYRLGKKGKLQVRCKQYAIARYNGYNMEIGETKQCIWDSQAHNYLRNLTFCTRYQPYHC